jgi:hypothetical protein
MLRVDFHARLAQADEECVLMIKPGHRPGGRGAETRAEPPRSRLTVNARRHLWAVCDVVYLLAEEEARSMRVRGMISRIGPDNLVHHPGNLADTGEKVWTMCAQRADDSWPLLYSTIVDCAECGAALQRQGLAVAMSPVLARSYEDQFMATQPVPHVSV